MEVTYDKIFTHAKIWNNDVSILSFGVSGLANQNFSKNKNENKICHKMIYTRGVSKGA